jgi:thiamine pyrophosphate-dependent acetolactate synthase large subunit-like protein
MSKKKSSVGRRGFLKTAAGGVAALMAKPEPAPAQPLQEAARPAPAAAAVDVGEGRLGADFMMDVIKTLNIEYCASTPGANFAALHESMINYGNNTMPEFLTCMHEEQSVAMAHGYAKIEGKPMMIMAHGTVGLQHASMAVYNAYADRVPIIIVLGNTMDATHRGGYTGMVHSAQDVAAMVREYTKWDDAPVSLPHFAESMVRAYQIATTLPYEPVVIVADDGLQDEPIHEKDLRIPKLVPMAPPQGDSGSVLEAAKWLVAAENPQIVTGRAARTPKGIDLLVELAEALQAPVIDERQRMNFPSKHPLYVANLRAAGGPVPDVLLGLEVRDLYSLTHRGGAKTATKSIGISTLSLSHKSNYGDAGRYNEADLAIAGDPEATLPALIEAVKRLTTADRRRVFQERGAKLSEAHRKAREQSRIDALVGWNSSPISTARLSAEMWALIKNEDWSLVGKDDWVSFWPTRLWDFSKHYQFIGDQGAMGIGYTAPASVGAALANRKHGRLTVNIQCDGDLNFAPGVLWTAAHHRIPILQVMHNNRAYHQEIMAVQGFCNRNNRGVDRAHIGTVITDPNVDYAKLAQAYGLYGEGPITDPNDLAPALKRGIERVKKGEPALIDVVTQPR